MVYNELALCLMMGKGFFPHPFYVFFFSVALGLLFGAVPGFFPRKTRRIVFMVIFGLIAFYYTVESGIGSSYGTYMTIGNLLQEAGNVAGKYGGQLARSILLGIPKAIVFFLPPVLWFLFGLRIMRRKAYPWKLCTILMAAGIVLTAFFGLLAGHSRLVGKAYGGSYTFYNATVNFGLGTSTRLHLKYALFGNKHTGFHDVSHPDSAASEDEAQEGTADTAQNGENGSGAQEQSATVSGKNEMDIDFSTVTGGESIDHLSEYLAGNSGTDKNRYTGLFEGKNLIMIAAESYSGVFINEELTPTLWRLTHNGFYFSDYYQPEWGGSTTTGEMAYLCGLAPQWGDESMTNTIGHNMYFTMGNQLQRLGYNSAAFHNGSYDYYERYDTHPNLGYDQWIANETGVGDICGYHYPEDEEFFEKTIPLFIDKQPFNIYYMTLSGHAPYEESRIFVEKYYDRVNEVVGDQYEETTKYYICYMMELEAAMTRLVASLEEAGIADDTVIVMVGDHFPYGLGAGDAWGNDEDYVVDLLKSDRSLEWNRDANTLVIWSGCLENENKDMACEISTPTFSLDVLPTLSNLFGLEFDSRLLIGRDVFSTAEPLVFWNTLDWVTNRGKYEAASDTWYGNEGYEEYDWDYIDSINKIVENRLLMSRVIVLNDYYGLIFGEDTVTQGGAQKIYTGPVTG